SSWRPRISSTAIPTRPRRMSNEVSAAISAAAAPTWASARPCSKQQRTCEEETMPDYSWPPMNKRVIMGTRLSRLDGPDKSTGRAKYNSDLNPKGLLFGALLTSPYAHARVKSIDTSAAEKMDGVTAVRVIAKAGTEVQWEGAEIASVA